MRNSPGTPRHHERQEMQKVIGFSDSSYFLPSLSSLLGALGLLACLALAFPSSSHHRRLGNKLRIQLHAEARPARATDNSVHALERRIITMHRDVRVAF